MLFPVLIFGQTTEKAIYSQDKNLSLFHAFIINTLKGNTITDFNDVNINTKKVGKYTLILKILKHQHRRDDSLFFKLSDTVLLNSKNNKNTDKTVDLIIKQVIRNRRKYLRQTDDYSAQMYAKNKYQILHLPERLLGLDFTSLQPFLNNRGTGIVYLSETLSTIQKKRKQLKETIYAVKVNGIENKIGFNRAANTNINFYHNTITLGDKLISPIAVYANFFYTYKLQKSFLENGILIHKIKVIPKYKNANALNGFIYVVDQDWQLYALDLYITGKQIQKTDIGFIKIKQNFEYHKNQKLWLLKNQKIDFDFNKFQIHLAGTMSAFFKDYKLQKQKLGLNRLTYQFPYKRDSLFWLKNRSEQLSDIEKYTYKHGDSLQRKHSSKKYLDSLTLAHNKFQFSDVFFDYNHQNLYHKNRFKISFPINVMFNTIQGWHTTAKFTYYKDKNHQNYQISSKINYGFSDKKIRFVNRFLYRFNDKKNSILQVSFGKQLTEFNDPYSTAPLFNTLSTLLFEENNSKYYNKNFSEISYKQEVLNGLFLNTKISYEIRKPEFNHANFVFINFKDTHYTSNNPLEPDNFTKAAIEKHQMTKLETGLTYKIGQKFLLFPTQKINLSTAYPKLQINYKKGISFSNIKYNFDYIEGRIFQRFQISNKGTFSYNIKAGTFLNKNQLSFIDYKHFDITQVHISLVKDYTNHFALLPSYAYSTNKKFAEFHAEHQFKGYLLDKIPLIKKLQFQFIIGVNTLLTVDHFPYSEFNIGLNNVGFGKFRFLRIDYVRSFSNQKSTGSFIFGLSL